MLNTVVSNLILTAEAPDFVRLRLVNNFRQSQNGWSMPDIAAGGEGWALFKISIKKNQISDAPIEVLRCFVSYIDQDGVPKKTSQQNLFYSRCPQMRLKPLRKMRELKTECLNWKLPVIKRRRGRPLKEVTGIVSIVWWPEQKWLETTFG